MKSILVLCVLFSCLTVETFAFCGASVFAGGRSRRAERRSARVSVQVESRSYSSTGYFLRWRR